MNQAPGLFFEMHFIENSSVILKVVRPFSLWHLIVAVESFTREEHAPGIRDICLNKLPRLPSRAACTICVVMPS